MTEHNTEQKKAAEAARELASYLEHRPLRVSDLPKLHILLSRVSQSGRAAFEELEAEQNDDIGESAPTLP